MQRELFALLLGCALSGVGCSRKPTPEQQALVLAAVPKDVALPLHVDFGGALELVSASVSPMRDLKLGSRVELTLYWRKTGDVPKGYRLFTHVLDEAGESILNLDNVGLLRKSVQGDVLLPPSAWETGKVYADKQAFSIPKDLRTDSIKLVCGLFRGDERLKITAGRQQSDRAIIADLPVARPPKPVGIPPVIWVPFRQAAWPIVIDGKLDDAVWTRATTTGQLVNAGTGEPQVGGAVTGTVRLIYDNDALYLAFEVFDEDVRGGFDPAQADPHLWTRDTVEVMIDPDGDADNKDYYEIQVGPQNLVFDSQFDDYNRPRVDPDGPFGHQEWSAQLRSAVEVHGTLDDAREDEGYTVEMAIPWSSLRLAKRTPPNAGDTWRMNFYAMENNGGAAWSPILGQGNFHRASRFGRVHFAAPPAPPRVPSVTPKAITPRH